MPMPDPTPDPGGDRGFLTPTRLAVVAVVAVAAAIAALAYAMNASQQDRDKEDAKQGVGFHRVSVSELCVASYRPDNSSYRSACESCNLAGFHVCV